MTGEEKLASYTGGLHVFKGYMSGRWNDLRERAPVSIITYISNI